MKIKALLLALLLTAAPIATAEQSAVDDGFHVRTGRIGANVNAFEVDTTGLANALVIVDATGAVTVGGALTVNGLLAFTAQLNLAAGTAAEPALGFTLDDDATGTGIYRVGADNIGISTNGTLRLDIESDGDVDIVGQVLLGAGTAADPILGQESDDDGSGTGLSFPGADQIVLGTNGTAALTLDASQNATIGNDLTVDGAATVTGTSTLTGAVTAPAGVTATDASGFNGNAGTQLVGIGLGAMDYVVGTNGRTEAETVRDDGETGTNWDEVTCAGGANTCMATPGVADAAVFKFGANSARLDLLTLAQTDTVGQTAFGAEDWEALENVGFWARSDATWSGTDFRLQLVDDGGTRSFAMEALTVADQWQFIEVDISSLAGGTGDVITQILIECNEATGANCSNRTLYIDNFYVWDTDDETALAFDILDQPEAVGSAWSFVTLDSGGQTHARTREVHCDTIAGSATTFVIDPDDNTYISVTDRSASTIELYYHRAAY